MKMSFFCRCVSDKRERNVFQLLFLAMQSATLLFPFAGLVCAALNGFFLNWRSPGVTLIQRRLGGDRQGKIDFPPCGFKLNFLLRRGLLTRQIVTRPAPGSSPAVVAGEQVCFFWANN